MMLLKGKGDVSNGATVREIDGQIVLDDPEALSLVRAVGKVNCVQTLNDQAERVDYFARRMEERCDSPDEVMIVLINVDDTDLNRSLADTLMPGHDWQAYRDRAEIPFARGLCTREGIQIVLDDFDKEAAKQLSQMPGEVAVVIFDHGVAEVFGRVE